MPLPPQGALIEQRINAKNITQSDLASAIGISQSNVSKIISGQRTLPKDKIKAAGDYLDIDEDVLHITAGNVPSDIEEIILEFPSLIKVIRKHGAVMRSKKSVVPAE